MPNVKDACLNTQLNMLAHYKVQKTLGQGRYGHVMKCLKLETKETVAVKVLKEKKKQIDNKEVRS